jgi:hypothetical protein
MMIAFVWPAAGGREVTRAKKVMSVFIRGQGRVPFSPIPRRVVVSSVACRRGMGVVATIRVKGFGCGILALMVIGFVRRERERERERLWV